MRAVEGYGRGLQVKVLDYCPRIASEMVEMVSTRAYIGPKVCVSIEGKHSGNGYFSQKFVKSKTSHISTARAKYTLGYNLRRVEEFSASDCRLNEQKEI